MSRVVLHEGLWASLQAQWQRLPHALLLVGQAGVGKLEFAEDVAAALLCEARRGDGHACGQCAGCRWHEQGNHPDFRLLRPAAEEAVEEAAEDGAEARKKPASREITIAQVRGLDDFMHVGTHRDGRRVVLIAPAEALNRAAANALLKTLEEPPPETVFLLVSDAPDRLLPTIRSRCRLLALPKPPAAASLAWLRARKCEDPEQWLELAGGVPGLADELARGDYAPLLEALAASLGEGRRLPVIEAAAKIDAILRADKRAARLPLVVEWTQRWCHDLALAATDQPACYFRRRQDRIRVLALEARPQRLFAFYRQAVDFKRLSEHTLNGRLFLEDLFSDYVGIFG